MVFYKPFLRVIWGYLLFSVGSAIAAPHVNLGGTSELMYLIPTVNTLTKLASAKHQITNYFVLMLTALPVVVLLLILAHPTKRTFIAGISTGRKVFSVSFLFFAILLLGWFAFFLPPDRIYVGTRMRILLHLASQTTVGLGLIYGLILVCLAVVLSATLLSIRDVPVRRRSGA